MHLRYDNADKDLLFRRTSINSQWPPRKSLSFSTPCRPMLPALSSNITLKSVVLNSNVTVRGNVKYGHVYKMAQSELKGINSVEGVEGILYQVKETLPEEILAKMHAAPKPDVPIINAHDLPDADGLMFGFPTRFGGMPSQMKALFDATGGLWSSNKLAGKPAAMFTSTASQGGGQETTILNSLSNVVHHGMIFVPAGYGFGAPLYSNEEARGGSAWGAGTLANGDGSRQPSKVELDFAEYQGKKFAEVVRKLAA